MLKMLRVPIFEGYHCVLIHNFCIWICVTQLGAHYFTALFMCLPYNGECPSLVRTNNVLYFYLSISNLSIEGLKLVGSKQIVSKKSSSYNIVDHTNSRTK